jgi:large subunit ribosomal protein L18e
MKTNAEKGEIREWLLLLAEASGKDHYPKLWKRVRRLVAVPARRRASVNLYKIERYSKDGENIIVPGKVLSSGEIKHKVNITAIEFSAPALKSLKEANCNVIGIKDMLKSKNVKVIV